MSREPNCLGICVFYDKCESLTGHLIGFAVSIAESFGTTETAKDVVARMHGNIDNSDTSQYTCPIGANEVMKNELHNMLDEIDSGTLNLRRKVAK